MTSPPASTARDWQAFHAKLRRYVQRRVAPEAADDVVGDVLLRLVEHREALRAAASPTAWMFRVAANAITDHYRRAAIEKRLRSGADPGSPPDPPAPHAPENSAPAELARCMIPMIRGLPAPYAEALMLTDIEGLTQAQAARRLGLSTSGMKSRVQRGRAKLRETLLRCCRIERASDGTLLDYEPRRCAERC